MRRDAEIEYLKSIIKGLVARIRVQNAADLLLINKAKQASRKAA